jgi:methylenetetrahydrofolate reductase (NADPH)
MARIADLLAAGRTFSFEFFPPRTEGAQLSLGRTIAELEPLQPSFVSVTYGAGGSTRERTHQVVTWVKSQTVIEPMAHLTCQGHSRLEIAQILANYSDAEVENILALGGDAPKEALEDLSSEYRYASDLVADVAATGKFSIGVAAHPEVHPRSPDRQTDREMLARKLEMADFAITQFFFESEHYVRLVNELADLGVTKPVLPGIMPITSLSQVAKMAEMSGAGIPDSVLTRLENCGSSEDSERLGIEIATELCGELLAAGAPGLHFYTLNKSTATREIYANLGLRELRP